MKVEKELGHAQSKERVRRLPAQRRKNDKNVWRPPSLLVEKKKKQKTARKSQNGGMTGQPRKKRGKRIKTG